MNDFELQSRLKGVPVPERPKEYWQDFPARMSRQLRRPVKLEASSEAEPLLRFAWQLAAGAAILCVCLAVLNQPLRAASTAMLEKEIALRRELDMFPKHLRILMADDHGMQYLVADKN
jgi:hypothetical protein